MILTEKISKYATLIDERKATQKDFDSDNENLCDYTKNKMH